MQHFDGSSIGNRLRRFMLAFSVLTCACSAPPPHRTLSYNAAERPSITVAPDGGTASTRLSVLTYNIEGLGWPARKGREAQLKEIGKRLSALRKAAVAPDIVLFQEVFSNAAKRGVYASGYPAMISGPRRTTRASGGATTAPLPGKAKIMLGEMGIHLVGSGLVTASRYPIVATQYQAFGPGACAGIDCLSNKGIVHARIMIPGVPTPIDIYNTHLNSQSASRAARERRIAAHERQTLTISSFIDTTRDPKNAVVLAGDFNMKHSDRRWRHSSDILHLNLVHSFCLEQRQRCKVKMSWDGDAPWMDTQDLQFFEDGPSMSIRPLKVEAMFDGRPGSPVLSDHDGFLVVYELRWRTTSQPASSKRSAP